MLNPRQGMLNGKEEGLQTWGALWCHASSEAAEHSSSCKSMLAAHWLPSSGMASVHLQHWLGSSPGHTSRTGCVSGGAEVVPRPGRGPNPLSLARQMGSASPPWFEPSKAYMTQMLRCLGTLACRRRQIVHHRSSVAPGSLRKLTPMLFCEGKALWCAVSAMLQDN